MSTNTPLNVCADVLAGGAVVGTLTGYFPLIAAIAAFLASLWYCVQLWDWWLQRRNKNDAGT